MTAGQSLNQRARQNENAAAGSAANSVSSEMVVYPDPASVQTVAVIGTGSVGASWAALFLAHGLTVVAYDPAPGARENAERFIVDAWPALVALGQATQGKPAIDRLSFVDTASQAAALADVVQENIPEKPELKARMLAELDAAASPEKIILSSTGGIPPSNMQQACVHPERLVVLHPFNPTHLIPLVEVIGGKLTAPSVIDWAMAFARRMGKQPIRLHVEASGHMTNRLQFALVREAVACLTEGIASAQDIDAAVRYGLGPRWTLMGSLLTLHLAGGSGGMQGILAHAGDAMQEWWTPKAQPTLDADVTAQLIAAAAQVSREQPVEQWVHWRDEALVALLALQREMETAAPGAVGTQSPDKGPQPRNDINHAETRGDTN